jgi:hypothetical protein
MTTPDNARRKQLRRQYKEQGYAAARAKFPLTPEQLDALHDHLETYGEPVGCNRTTRVTEAWIGQNGLNLDRVLESLHEAGGYCDCEVLANVARDRFGWPERPDDAG